MKTFNKIPVQILLTFHLRKLFIAKVEPSRWMIRKSVENFLSKFNQRGKRKGEVRAVGCRKRTHKHWILFLNKKRAKTKTSSADRCCKCTCRSRIYKVDLTPPPNTDANTSAKVENPKSETELRAFVLVQSGRRLKRIFFHFPHQQQQASLRNRIKFVVGRGFSKATKAFALTGCVSWNSKNLENNYWESLSSLACREKSLEGRRIFFT